MNFRSLVITFLLVILCTNVLLEFVPPEPIPTLGSLAVGAVLGLVLSRFIVLPTVEKYE